jgi:hypothetical protein
MLAAWSGDFLQVLELPTSLSEADPIGLSYDPEWLAILRRTHNCLSLQRHPLPLSPSLFRSNTADELEWMRARLVAAPHGLTIPSNFVPTRPFHDPHARQGAPQQTGRTLLCQSGLFFQYVNTQPTTIIFGSVSLSFSDSLRNQSANQGSTRFN